MITVTPAVQAIIESDSIRSCFLVALPNLYLTTAPSDISWGGNTYQSDGTLLRLDGRAATGEISANTYKIELDNANRAALSIYGNGNYLGLPVSIHYALLDSDGQLIPDPVEHFAGIFDGWSVKETTTSSKVLVTAKSHWAAFERKAGRFTNQSSQQEINPNDTFFNSAHEDKAIYKWGNVN